MITSKSNRKVKEIVKLQKDSKARERKKLFVVEGSRLVYEAYTDQIKEVYISEAFLKKHMVKDKSYQIVSDEVFSYISDTKSPQGILAVVRQKAYPLDKVIGKQKHLLLLLESIQDPGNLGTIFRAAEAAGITGIIMNDQCADIYNPKTIRGTMGSIYRIPFIVVDDFENVARQIKEANIKLYATHINGKTSYDKYDYREGSAFFVGNEGSGLTNKVVKLADELIRIPMLGQVESLNVAVATTALVFEVARQRRDSH